MREKKEEYVDDGHTIYNMDIEGMPTRRTFKRNNKDQDIYVSKEERHSLMFAALKAFLPKGLLILACFFLTLLLIYFWLH